MDYPKEFQYKKKQISNSLNSNSKQLPQQQHPPIFPPHHKGKIRIEQYEYDEENILGQGFSSKVYLGRLA